MVYCTLSLSVLIVLKVSGVLYVIVECTYCAESKWCTVRYR